MVKYSDYEAARNILENWILTQPHLPKIDTLVLKRFIIKCNGDTERAKKLIDLHYTMRAANPEIFLYRDPMDESQMLIKETIEFLPLPKRTEEGYVVYMVRFIDNDLDKFNFEAWIKSIFIFFDLQNSCLDDNGFSNGEIMVFDMTGLTLKHLTKLNIALLANSISFFEKVITFKIRSIQIINCQPSLDKLLVLIKPLIRKKLFERLKFHLPTEMDKFYEFVPKDLLPTEYDGNAGPAIEIKEKLYKILEEKRDYIMDPEYWEVDINKKPANKLLPDQMEGNFKKLNID
ncbi:alpha-tocopherol transfer protein-like [Condylostylus longicornis]|uniref:alpha-tocopherol transfer protein-like n=1 Tax=Condylostylus longicornis TaxID=2530218 RepID=UPI00244DC75D|nr:alpha-tocopherol transfer protein-like [Condylostylus longicornis]